MVALNRLMIIVVGLAVRAACLGVAPSRVRASPRSAGGALRLEGGEVSVPDAFLIDVRAVAAELVGTALLVALGSCTVAAAQYAGAQQGIWQVAASWGAAVVVAVACTAPISGAHLNPAITLALTLFRGFPASLAARYVGAQVLGASLGATVCRWAYARQIAAFEVSKQVTRGSAAAIVSAPGILVSSVGLISTIVLEAVQTAILTFVVFAITDARQEKETSKAAPFFVGLTVAALISGFGPLTQTGINPARDLGPRLVAYFTGWGGHAFAMSSAYLLGPLFGCVAGGLLHRALFT